MKFISEKRTVRTPNTPDDSVSLEITQALEALVDRQESELRAKASFLQAEHGIQIIVEVD